MDESLSGDTGQKSVTLPAPDKHQISYVKLPYRRKRTLKDNSTSVQYRSAENRQSSIPNLIHQDTNSPSGSSKRPGPSSSVIGADSTDCDDEDHIELPATGLIAPWEVLRGLADVALQRLKEV
jgi:hypothetical protein